MEKNFIYPSRSDIALMPCSWWSPAGYEIRWFSCTFVSLIDQNSLETSICPCSTFNILKSVLITFFNGDSLQCKLDFIRYMTDRLSPIRITVKHVALSHVSILMRDICLLTFWQAWENIIPIGNASKDYIDLIMWQLILTFSFSTNIQVNPILGLYFDFMKW